MLRDALASTGRTTSFVLAQPIAHDYTLNSSRRGETQPSDVEKYIAPVPERRIVITFHDAPLRRPARVAEDPTPLTPPLP